MPAGTDLTLTAHVTKDLAEVFLKAKNPQDLRELRIRDADAQKLKAAGLQVEPAAGDSSSVVVRPARDGDALRMPVAIGADRRGFRIQLPDVRRDLALVLEFTDADGVKGRREVRVQAQVDTAPDLKEVTHPLPAQRHQPVRQGREEGVLHGDGARRASRSAPASPTTTRSAKSSTATR